jgi:uncharacterized protein (TIGR03067 family)
MRLRLEALAIFCLLAATTFGSAEEKPNRDQEAIQGTWQMMSSAQDGKPAPERLIKTSKLTFSRDRLTTILGDERHELTFRLYPDQSPKQIDIGLGEGKAFKGIYELKGDTLTVAHGKVNRPRPGDFTSKEGIVLGTFRRAQN